VFVGPEFLIMWAESCVDRIGTTGRTCCIDRRRDGAFDGNSDAGRLSFLECQRTRR